MYDLFEYGCMIADRVRMTAYARALRQAIKPGAVVLDLGAGTGIFALLAAKFGARRVYAVELNDAIEVARKIPADNGFGQRIEFIHELSTRITLPEPVDVIVSDVRGALPLSGQSLVALMDARRRFLAPGGVLIPRQDTLWAVVVEAPEIYHKYVSPWQDNGLGFNLAAARQIVTNIWRNDNKISAYCLSSEKVTV